jgi:hypothetical protein
MSKQIEEANLLERELKEERKRAKVEAKKRAKEVEVEAKKRAKEKARELKEEAKVALALAALEVPTSKGVRWNRRESCWKVQLSAHGKQWHLGYFDFDDHTKAVGCGVQ